MTLLIFCIRDKLIKKEEYKYIKEKKRYIFKQNYSIYIF